MKIEYETTTRVRHTVEVTEPVYRKFGFHFYYVSPAGWLLDVGTLAGYESLSFGNPRLAFDESTELVTAAEFWRVYNETKDIIINKVRQEP